MSNIDRNHPMAPGQDKSEAPVNPPPFMARKQILIAEVGPAMSRLYQADAMIPEDEAERPNLYPPHPAGLIALENAVIANAPQPISPAEQNRRILDARIDTAAASTWTSAELDNLSQQVSDLATAAADVNVGQDYDTINYVNPLAATDVVSPPFEKIVNELQAAPPAYEEAPRTTGNMAFDRKMDTLFPRATGQEDLHLTQMGAIVTDLQSYRSTKPTDAGFYDQIEERAA